MDETGTKIGGSYTQSINGTDEYTMIDEGNLGDGHYTRGIEGTGTYERISEGPGATQPTDAGGYTYLWEQTGDPHSGVFDLTQSGTDRYDLLEDFFDISNIGNGQTPGHMNVYPFGQAFVDPNPGDPSALPGQQPQGQWMVPPLPRPLPRIVVLSAGAQRLVDNARRDEPEELMECGVFPAGAILRGFAAALARSQATGALAATTAAGANARSVVHMNFGNLYRAEAAALAIVRANPTLANYEVLAEIREAIRLGIQLRYP